MEKIEHKSQQYPYLKVYLDKKIAQGKKISEVEFLSRRNERRLRSLDEICSGRAFKTRYEEFSRLQDVPQRKESEYVPSSDVQDVFSSLPSINIFVIIVVAIFFPWKWLFYIVAFELIAVACFSVFFLIKSVKNTQNIKRFPLSAAYFKNKFYDDTNKNIDEELCLESLTESLELFTEKYVEELRYLAGLDIVHKNGTYPPHAQLLNFARVLLGHRVHGTPFTEETFKKAVNYASDEKLKNAKSQIEEQAHLYVNADSVRVTVTEESSQTSPFLIGSIAFVLFVLGCCVFFLTGKYYNTKNLLLDQAKAERCMLLENSYQQDVKDYQQEVDRINTTAEQTVILDIKTVMTEYHSLGTDLVYEYYVNGEKVFNGSSISANPDGKYLFEVRITEEDDTYSDYGSSRDVLLLPPDDLSKVVSMNVSTTVKENSKSYTNHSATFNTTITLGHPSRDYPQKPIRKSVNADSLDVSCLKVWASMF